MKLVLAILRKISVAILHITIAAAVPALITTATITSQTNRNAVAEAFIQTDITPVFIGFDGDTTPAYDALFAAGTTLQPELLMPALNVPELKACAVRYFAGSIEALRTGTAGTYPAPEEVATALTAARQALANPVTDDEWNNTVKNCSDAIYPPESFFPYLNPEYYRSDKTLVHIRNILRDISPRALAVRFGILLTAAWGLMSLCSLSIRKGMKHTGSAVLLGGVIAVILPAAAYFGLRRYDTGANGVITETLYYGRFLMSVLKPVIKTIGISAITCIISGAVLENTADRTLIQDRDTDTD